MDIEGVFVAVENILGIKRLSTTARSLFWKVVCTILFALAFWLFGYDWRSDNRIVNGIVGGLKIGLSSVLGYTAAVAYIRARRIVLQPAVDNRASVLYLRSFRDDSKAAVPLTTSLPFLPSLSSEEEHLAQGLRPIGPFIAIGIPGEELAPLGAVRRYLSEDEWRDRIGDLMNLAKLVVLRVGDTASLLWELGLAVQKLPPERLVLLVSERSEYDNFRQVASPPLPKPLPDYKQMPDSGIWVGKLSTNLRAFVFFSRDWSPTFVPLLALRWRQGKPLTRALISGMRPVYEQLNVAWTPPGLSWAKIGGVAAGALAVAVFVANMLSTPSAPRGKVTQASCTAGSATSLGRARLNSTLSQEARAQCCMNYPWLLGC